MATKRAQFVGRAAELSALQAHFAAATGGHARIVIVHGEAGIGKSRLSAEFIGLVPDETQVLVGACVRVTGRALPFAPVTQMLRGLVEELGLVTVHELAGPAIGALAGALPGESQNRVLTVGQSALFDDVMALLKHLSRRQPTVILIEDVHWADRSTLDLITYVARNLARDRVLVVLTYRADGLDETVDVPAFLAELVRLPLTERIDLAPLSEAETTDMLTDLLGERADPAVVERVVARCAGNAFFVEEVAAAGATEPEIVVPPALRDIIRLRLNQLDATAARILDVIAVAAGSVDHASVVQVSGCSDDVVTTAVRDGLQAGILVVDPSTGDYDIRHALARQCIVEDILPVQRRDIHARLAAALSDIASGGPTRLGGEHARATSATAHHWAAAGVYEHALPAAVQACRSSLAIHAYAEARDHGALALQMWDEVPEARPDDLSVAELLHLVAEATRWSGDAGSAAALVARAIEEMPPDDRAGRAGLCERLGRYRWVAGDTTGSLDAYRDAGRLLEDEPLGSLHARVAAAEGNALMLAGHYRRSRERCEEAVKIALRVDAMAAESHARIALGVAMAMLGDVDDGVAELGKAAGLAEAAGSFEDRCRVAANLSYVLDHAGRLEHALRVAGEGLELARSQGRELSGGGVLYTNTVSFLLRLGHWDEVERLTDEALRRPMPRGYEIYLRVYRAELDIARGRSDEAAAHLETAQLVAIDEPQYLGQLHAAGAELAWWSDACDKARAHIDAGFAVVTGSEEYHLLCRLASLGVRVEADEAERARALGDVDRVDAASERAAAMLAASPSTMTIAGDPEAAAQLQLAHTEHARLRGADDPAGWRDVAADWDALGQPYRACYARWRLAQAELCAGDRRAAVTALRAAHMQARGLRAHWLSGEISGLARRARLDLDELNADVTGDMAAPSRQAADQFSLTSREREVIGYVASGCTNGEIARQLFITEKTASVHVSNLIRKLGVGNRGEVAAVAYRLGMVETNS